MAQVYSPKNGRLLIKKLQKENTTASGLILSTPSEAPTTGKIIAINDGRLQTNGTMLPCPYQVGEVVMLVKMAGQTIKLNGEDVLLINESDIILTITEE